MAASNDAVSHEVTVVVAADACVAPVTDTSDTAAVATARAATPPSLPLERPGRNFASDIPHLAVLGH